MANGQATAKTKAKAERAKAYLEAVNRDAIQRTVEIAQTTDDQGGAMGFDTGWLRASMVAQIGDAAPAATSNPFPSGGVPKVTYDAGPVNLVINRAKPSDVVTAFWTANYARPAEYRDGFRRLAAQRWPQTVEASKKAAKAAMK